MAEGRKPTPLEDSTWEDDKYINHATVFKEGNVEGVAIKTAKKYGNGKTQWRKSFWLQKDQNVNT